MPNWDDQRGHRHDADRDRERWRRDQPRDRGPGGGGRAERRSFGEERRYDEPGRRGGEDWRRDDRYAARFDQDRTGYGREEDAGAAGYRLRPDEAGRQSRSATAYYQGEPLAYGGQEYGMEGHGGGWGFERDRGPGAGPGAGQPQSRPMQGPAPAYGQGRQGAAEHDLDPDYLRWRDEQMRGHDRDYEAWRRQQHREYDEQYRQFRDERQRHFGEAFHQWRSQRGAVGGVPDTSVAPGVSGYGDKTGVPGGYSSRSAYERPSGMLDPPGHLSSDPALQQVGGGRRGPSPGGPMMRGPTSDAPEFGREPPQVQASADGRVQGRRDWRQEEDEDQARLYGEKPRR
jgi:hypothetical protein